MLRLTCGNFHGAKRLLKRVNSVALNAQVCSVGLVSIRCNDPLEELEVGSISCI